MPTNKNIVELLESKQLYSRLKFKPTSETPVNCDGFFLFTGAKAPKQTLPLVTFVRCRTESDFDAIASQSMWTHWAELLVVLS